MEGGKAGEMDMTVGKGRNQGPFAQINGLHILEDIRQGLTCPGDTAVFDHQVFRYGIFLVTGDNVALKYTHKLPPLP